MARTKATVCVRPGQFGNNPSWKYTAAAGGIKKAKRPENSSYRWKCSAAAGGIKMPNSLVYFVRGPGSEQQ